MHKDITNTIRVCLVEDDDNTRERLAQAILQDARLTLAFQASSASQIMAWLTANQNKPCDVLLVDLGLPDGSGLDVIQAARIAMPTCECLVVTMFGDESNMIKAFEAGARGYLLKDGTQEHLVDHVMHIHTGGSPISPAIARQLIARLTASPQTLATNIESAAETVESPIKLSTSSTAITARELEVLRLISRGYTYPELAKLMGISLSTVHSHVKNIFGKLAVNSKTEAVFEARQLGLLK